MKGISLFEVSWEVCNKVGGIYAVVSSKALHAVEAFGGDYYALGPDLGNNPGFEETHEACWEPIRQTLSVRNLSCRFGRWAIPGRPKAILKHRFPLSPQLLKARGGIKIAPKGRPGGFCAFRPCVWVCASHFPLSP